jgi:bacillolysin
MRPPFRIAFALVLLGGAVAAAVPALGPYVQRVAPGLTVDESRTPEGALRFLSTLPGRPSGLRAEDVVAQVASPRSDLVELATVPRLDGGTAVRYQQELDGIPVFGGEATVQLDPDGAVVSSLLDLTDPAADPPAEGRLTAEAARRRAIEAVARDTGVGAASLRTSAPERWIFDPLVVGSPAPLGTRLTWRVEVTTAGAAVRQLVLVDALTGGIALSFSELGHAQDRRVCDFASVPTADPTCTSPYARAEGDPPSGQPDVDHAYDHIGDVYAFYKGRFNRDSIDDAGMPIVASVRYCRPVETCPLRNAFWDGQEAVFGAGYPVDDVAAHELTHGVTEHSARLYFWQQSGAINESMSDVMGELVDLTNGTGNDTAGVRWLIGEELPVGPLRSMSNPPSFGDPDRMSSPLFVTGPGDGGGVHTNSGVSNKAASLLVDGGTFSGHTVTALGVDRTAAIYYETLTTLLTSASDYRDLGAALPQACLNLLGVEGITTADCVEVEDAVAATEMALEPAGGPPPEAPLCSAGDQVENSFFDDLEDPGSGNWRTSTAAGWAWSYPPPDYARFATSGTRNLWGPDTGTPQSAPGTPLNHGDARIRMTEGEVLPPEAFLHFRHAWAFDSTGQTNYDGGVVEYSSDGGPWTDLGPRFTTNGYNGTLTVSLSTNPLQGRDAFVGTSRGYTSSRANLSSLAGHSVRIRFRIGEDATVGGLGWYIDDVRLATCAEPGLRITQTVDSEIVTTGEPIDLHITVENEETEPATHVTISDPNASDCAVSLGRLEVGQSATLDCSVTADTPGTFTNTASVSSNEFPKAVDAEPIEVTVLAPGSAGVAVELRADEDLVVIGEPVHLHLAVRNTGNVALTGITITDPNAPDCEKPVPSLPVGDSFTVDCTHTPTAVGTYTNAATVTAAEVADPTSSASVPVEVIDITGPDVTIDSPLDGQVLNEGGVVPADFTCTDVGGSGVASCVGSVDDGEPLDTSTIGDHAFNVVASDQSGNRRQVTHAYTVALRRPDGRLRLGATGTLVGNDLYNTTGVGQTRSGSALRGQTVVFYATVQNDGTEPERLRLRGQASTSRFSVQYRSAGVDITSGVVAGTWQTPVLAPGAMRTIKILVTVATTAPRHAAVSRTLTAASASDPTKKDVVKMVVSRA